MTFILYFLPVRLRSLFQSSSRPSGMAISLSPQQQRSLDRGADSLNTNSPFANAYLTDGPSNQLAPTMSTEIWTAPIFSPFLPISQSQLKLFLPSANERTACFIWSIPSANCREQLVVRIGFPMNGQWALFINIHEFCQKPECSVSFFFFNHSRKCYAKFNM